MVRAPTHTLTHSEAVLLWERLSEPFRMKMTFSNNPHRTIPIWTPHFLTNDLWTGGGFQLHVQNHPQWPGGRRLCSRPTHWRMNAPEPNNRQERHNFHSEPVKWATSKPEEKETIDGGRDLASPAVSELDLTFSLILLFHLAAWNSQKINNSEH